MPFASQFFFSWMGRSTKGGKGTISCAYPSLGYFFLYIF